METGVGSEQRSEEMSAWTWKPAVITGDWWPAEYDGEIVTNERWNGWVIPRFRLEAAQQIVENQAKMNSKYHDDDPLIELVWEGASIKVIDSDHGVIDWITPEDGWFYIFGMEWCWEEVEA